VCWDDKDVMNGKPTGAIRASLGYITTWEDVDVRQAKSSVVGNFHFDYFFSRLSLSSSEGILLSVPLPSKLLQTL